MSLSRTASLLFCALIDKESKETSKNVMVIGVRAMVLNCMTFK